MLETGKIAGTGFEPGNPDLVNALANYTTILDARDKRTGFYPDEVLAHFGTDDLQGYVPFTTPTFSNTSKKAHEFTTQDELMSFVQGLAAAHSHVHVYNLGQTANYSYDMPLVIVTTSDIPAGATFDEAVKIIRENGKLNVWHQAQIHPNEPASGEAALVMLQEMAGDYGAMLLDKINFISVPRLNPDGSYLFTRVTYGGYDMNRDHMRIQAVELEYSHKAFSAVLPEVAIDGHEFTYWGGSTAYGPNARMSNTDDVQSTPASSLNNNAAVNAFAMNQVSTRLHEKLAGVGLRNNNYGYTVNNPIGRAYMGLYNATSYLVETRGIGAGKQNFPRRVFAQVTAAKSITEPSALYADYLKKIVAEARNEVIAKGAIYDEDDKLVLYQTYSNNTRTPYNGDRVIYNMDGSVYSSTLTSLAMNDIIEYSRTRPTAYIIPKDAAPSLLSLDLALYITECQGAEIFEIEAGTTIPVQQYYTTGTWTGNTPSVDLRPEAEVTFESGTYVIPMDQVCGNVLGMLFEPDVRDSSGYNGTLVQSGIMTHDATTNDYPLYRFIQDNPREVLGLNAEEPHHGGGSSSNCSALGVGGLLSLLMIGAGVPLLARKRRK